MIGSKLAEAFRPVAQVASEKMAEVIPFPTTQWKAQALAA